ncbi:MAG: MotA/TolQ/ExbB proton channel family protein [Methyloglobulus sp.]|nr:MotA/TolQ/ExbB proton channel family protein [Methyloglobulus sp.]
MDLSETSIVNATLWLLGCFSLLTWSITLLKLGEWGVSACRNYLFTKNIWNTSEHTVRINLDSAKVKSQYARIYQSGQKILAKIPSQQALRIDQYTAWHELIERALKQQIQKEKSVMESGLGWLASFGSTSPFVGLFGTVWGIMHALQDISTKGSASLEVVAGPIGEALIATGIGIAVAVPAVLGYNLFIRLNRGTTAKLEHFAEDYLQAIIQGHLQQQMETTHGNADPK